MQILDSQHLSPGVLSRWLLSGMLTMLCCAPAFGADYSQQRERWRSALESVERGPQADSLRARMEFADYPLLPYLELAALKRGNKTLPREEVLAFLKRWPDTLVAHSLRDNQLRELAGNADWDGFRALWQASKATDLQCAWQRARLAAGEKPDYAKDIQPLWMQPRISPTLCQPLFDWAAKSGTLPEADIWDRLEASAAAGNPNAASAVAGMLNAEDRPAGERIAAAVRDPASNLAKAESWPDTARNRQAIALGLARYARSNSGAAEVRWAALEPRFKWDAEQKNRVLNALAVFRSTSYSSDALSRLNALPEAAKDDNSREWHVRVALETQDWKETLAALDDLAESQKTDPRWRYLRARMLSKLERNAEAQPLFSALADEANFHGFLAADWLNQPYAICPETLASDDAALGRIAEQADLARAFEFHALGDLASARREWDFAMAKLDAPERRLAALRAYQAHWYDRAVFLLSADADSLRVYEQRFPLGLKPRVTRGAKDAGIDPAWAYAIIRAESAWMSDARSHADAYGLMQLLPGVAAEVAKAHKLPYSKAQDLFDPALNIQLGTRFLGQMANKYQGSPWLASAAYNAGQTPVNRWLAARSALEPDFFIETIPYRETREYVSRILAFSVIYDWRLNQRVIPLAARMPRIGQAYAPPDDASLRKAVICPAPASARL